MCNRWQRINLSGLVFAVIGADYKVGSNIGMQVNTIVGCSGCSAINQWGLQTVGGVGRVRGFVLVAIHEKKAISHVESK